MEGETSGNDPSPGETWRVGDGNYSTVILTTWEGKACVVKAIRRYRDRLRRGKKKRHKEVAKAVLEEAADVLTEVRLLSDASLDGVAPWRWRPDFYAHVAPQELEMAAQEAIHTATGFEPGALLYMERLSTRFDLHLQELGGSEAGAKEALGLLCDCLAILVELHRRGLRHNDCMMRNVMLRRLPQPRGTPPRQLRLETDPPSLFEWEGHPELEVVLIDFGLASAAPSSPLRAKGVVTDETRDAMYANAGNGARLSSGMHPLEMSCDGFARALIDLQCLSFNLQKMAAQKKTHPLLGRWCRQAYKAIDSAQHEADMRESPVCFETTVGTLMPPVARRSIVAAHNEE